MEDQQRGDTGLGMIVQEEAAAGASCPAKRIRTGIFLAVYLLVLGTGIGLKIYKTHAAGIIFDEEYTYANFGRDANAALHSYQNPNNNHVLNSLLICWTGKYFRGYEHFVRLPSLIFGVLFSLAAGLLVCQVLRSSLLRLLILAAITLNASVFDLSFLARGYSYALAAVFGGIVLIIQLLRHPIRYRYCGLVIAAMVVVNFVALGAMISSLWVLLCLNLLFVLTFSGRIYRNPPRQRFNILVHGLCIALLSGAALFALYHGLYQKIIAARGDFRVMPYGVCSYVDFVALPFRIYMKWALWDNLVNPQSWSRTITFYALSGLMGASVLFYTWLIARNAARSGWLAFLKRSTGTAGGLIVLVTVIYVLLLFIHHNVLRMSIGLPRNAVFLLPLVLLIMGMLLEGVMTAAGKGWKRLVAAAAIAAVLAMVVWQNLPDSTSVNRLGDWDLQSLSGPLLRRLKAMDSRRTWRIRLTYEMGTFYVGTLYYQRYDYNFNFAVGPDYDVEIRYKTEGMPKGIYWDRTYFDRFNCRVRINPVLAEQGVFRNEPLMLFNG